ncbi:2Fe-2S iron-sulfur cluster-binding protein [Massilia rhizosphaerae]|uniref:2Fe-2S iron-sulfur cluster-binding protein n=1 Tax=Massilia rhizosphaerae TaxID=2784389 RepID=UPI0018DD3242|nr:2Fe-2S iron-sulfur cluster-binding protein [Massilia rhizosphaerae]
MSLVTLSSGKSFQAPDGVSILDAAAQANIALPYSCKTGRCSTCKCKVLTGTTHALRPETGLSEQEHAEGWVLSCARAADTDLVLEVDDLGGIELPRPKMWPCRIKEIIHLAPDVVKVILRLPPTADFQFVPGQYIDVIGPNGIRRSYSLANSSFADKVLELHIRAVEGGAMSDYWFKQAKPNDLLRLNGPLGTFFLRETVDIDLVFLATGTGIAPVKSMLESMAQCQFDQRPRSITVLWGGRHAQDLYLDVDEIIGEFSYIPVQSRPANDWTGARGYVQDVLLDAKPDLTNAVVYACGSDAMIHSAKVRLVEAGLPDKRFYSDAFVSSGAK